MTTLSKVFVVVLAVFTIAFTTLTIGFVAQTPNWKDLADKYRTNTKVVDTNLRHVTAVSAAVQAAAEDRIRDREDVIHRLEGDLEKANQEVASLKAELAKVASEKSGTEAMNRGLFAQLKVAGDARTEYRNQRDELEMQNAKLQDVNIDLDDRVNEQTAQIVVLREQIRQFEQQINILKGENQRLAQTARRAGSGAGMEAVGGVALSGVTAVSPVASTSIRGEIVKFDGKRAMISVGSADGVKQDMIFVVYRDGTYVGDLQISLVEPDQAVGRIVQSTTDIQVGDAVADVLTMGTSRG